MIEVRPGHFVNEEVAARLGLHAGARKTEQRPQAGGSKAGAPKKKSPRSSSG